MVSQSGAGGGNVNLKHIPLQFFMGLEMSVTIATNQDDTHR